MTDKWPFPPTALQLFQGCGPFKINHFDRFYHQTVKLLSKLVSLSEMIFQKSSLEMQTIFALQWIWQIMPFHFAFPCLVLKTGVLVVRMHPLAIMSLVEKPQVLFLTPSTLNHNSQWYEVSWRIKRQLISSTGSILEIQYLLRWERETAELVTCSPGCHFCASLPFLYLILCHHLHIHWQWLPEFTCCLQSAAFVQRSAPVREHRSP